MTDQTNEREIRADCEALSIAYARAVDFRDYDTFASLFTEDGVLDVGQPLEGRDAIRTAMSRRPDELRSRHILTNIFIDVVSTTEARGISYLTLYRHVGAESLKREPIPFDGPAAVGHYEDRYVLTDDGWKFKRRQLHLAFRRAR
jgi:ketosteroid isomerase-like protein